MENNQIDLITKMFEYNLWANTQLIKVCSDLDDEQLEIEVEGVYGRIHPTLVHLLRAECGYLNRLIGSRPWADDLDWEDLPMSDLLAKAQLSGEQFIKIASKVNPTIRHEVEFEGKPYHFFNWTVLLQALQHGIEHRTHIKVLLTHLGVDHPDLDAWEYRDFLSSE